VPRARSAFTLLELVLVMAILAIMAALAIPSIDAMMAQNRLNAAVDQVRWAWSTARARALEEGLSYRFSIHPGENSYRIAPDNEAFAGNGTGTSPAADEVSTPPLVLEEKLPSGVRFSLVDDAIAGDPSADGSGDGSTAPTPGNTDSNGWFGVAVFLPDGTCRQDVNLLFQGSGAVSRILSLRALTGVVKVRIASAGR